MCSVYSVYDELEGRVDSMVAYKTCYLCHNGNKKCERPPSGGQCKRCANTYISHPWALNNDPPSFYNNKITKYFQDVLEAFPNTALSLFENPTDFHTLTISLANPPDSDICEPSTVHFSGPLKHDNPYAVPAFDQIVHRHLSAPRLEVKEDPQGLVAQACLAGGYLKLLFSVETIDDRSHSPLDPRALIPGLARFILMRISSIVSDVMSLAHVGPISRNARLCLAALHVIVNRIQLSTSRQGRLRLFYDDPELSTLLKDRIHAIEGELRLSFQSHCALIKDWGGPLNSARKEFKNTAQSLDPLILNITVSTWDDLPECSMYPVSISTPSESEQSPLSIGSLPEVGITLQFAGLEDNKAFETENSWISDNTSAASSLLSKATASEYDYISTEKLFAYNNKSADSPNPLHCSDQDMQMADPSDQSAYNHLSAAGNPMSDWELLFNSADYQEQDLGSPIQWDSDPGNSDVALN